MSPSPSPESTPEPAPRDEVLSTFSVQITYHIPVPKDSTNGWHSKGKASKKTKKETKSKELIFHVDEDGYLSFLKALLEKHSKTRYQVTASKPFSFKYYYHTWSYVSSLNFSCNDNTHIQVHAISKAAALDVDTENEYKAMVGKIIAEKLKNVMILVDMKDIQKACSVRVSV